MAKSTFAFKLDDSIKSDLEKICNELGMSVGTFFNMAAKKLIRERKFNVELPEEDYFYSEENIARLKKAKQRVENGEYILKSINEVLDYGDK